MVIEYLTEIRLLIVARIKRIPDNWYKRGIDYTIPLYTLDLLYAGLKHPEFLSIGGNVSTIHRFLDSN